jgi:pimeloyl-ACP methyl ester carboxylesterase
MILLHYPAPGAGIAARALLVMLPGAGIEAADFAAHGMVAAVHDRGLAVDTTTRPDIELYLDGGVADELQTKIIGPALAAGYRRIWLLGISLGGMGALQYAERHARQLAGIILLAPFLGTQGTIADIAAAGGLADWAADPATPPIEGRMLIWLQNFLASRPDRPSLYLGYGEADRFARGHRLLAQHLPAGHVMTHSGGHDWETWLALWRALLDNPSFAAQLDDNASRPI